MDRFTSLLPNIGKIEPLGSDKSMACWKAFDQAGALMGYAFLALVPQADPDIDLSDMDRYRVVGLVDPQKFTIAKLDVALDPGGPDTPWEIKITEPEFASQYIGLAANDLELSPDGKIDGIAEATLSSKWVTEAIRLKVVDIVNQVGG